MAKVTTRQQPIEQATTNEPAPGKAPKAKTETPKAPEAPKPAKPQPVPPAVKKEATEAKRKAQEARAKASTAAHTAMGDITREIGCACGCGEMVPIRRFKPGHDAKLLSRLIGGEALPASAFVVVAQIRKAS